MLSKRDNELLTMLAEECAEVIQAITKIQRHGYESYNPLADVAVTNIQSLNREILDVSAIVLGLENAGVVEEFTKEDLEAVLARKLTWTHHQ